ncbi:hypothetical protein D3C87_1473820 [compost metagenome]
MTLMRPLPRMGPLGLGDRVSLVQRGPLLSWLSGCQSRQGMVMGNVVVRMSFKKDGVRYALEVPTIENPHEPIVVEEKRIKTRMRAEVVTA